MVTRAIARASTPRSFTFDPSDPILGIGTSRAASHAMHTSLSDLRDQISFTRSLLDTLESRLPPASDLEPPGRELVVELSRLGCLVLETATAFTTHHRAMRPSSRRMVSNPH